MSNRVLNSMSMNMLTWGKFGGSGVSYYSFRKSANSDEVADFVVPFIIDFAFH